MNSSIKILLIALLIIFLDQISKYVSPIFGYEIIFNRGVSFSFFDLISSEVMSLGILIFLALIFVFLKKDWTLNPIAAGLFFGGAVSNILDRLFLGAVRDWLLIPFFDIYNNLADWFIFLGLMMFLIYNNHSNVRSEKLTK